MKIGYSLYSARESYHDSASLERILRAIAQLGYDGVEFFHYARTPASELSAILKDTGLSAPSSHIHTERWLSNTMGEIEYAAQAGIQSLVFPWLNPEHRTPEAFLTLKNRLPELAKLAASRGITLHYHNHDFEFARMGDGYVMDYILQGEGFQFEFDSFWAQFAQVDPVDYLRTCRNRIDMVHLKDYSTLQPQPVYCPIGTGKMDNKQVILEAKQLGTPWIFVELDDCPIDPIEAAKISLNYIRNVIA